MRQVLKDAAKGMETKIQHYLVVMGVGAITGDPRKDLKLKTKNKPFRQKIKPIIGKGSPSGVEKRSDVSRSSESPSGSMGASSMHITSKVYTYCAIEPFWDDGRHRTFCELCEEYKKVQK